MTLIDTSPIWELEPSPSSADENKLDENELGEIIPLQVPRPRRASCERQESKPDENELDEIMPLQVPRPRRASCERQENKLDQSGLDETMPSRLPRRASCEQQQAAMAMGAACQNKDVEPESDGSSALSSSEDEEENEPVAPTRRRSSLSSAEPQQRRRSLSDDVPEQRRRSSLDEPLSTATRGDQQRRRSRSLSNEAPRRPALQIQVAKWNSLQARRQHAVPQLSLGPEGGAVTPLSSSNRRLSGPTVELLPLESAAVRSTGTAGRGDFDLSELYELSDNPCRSGSMSVVHKGWRRSDRLRVALKEVPCPDGSEELRAVTKREYELMCKLEHPSIVRAHAMHETPHVLVVCMELCESGSLQSYVKRHGRFLPDAAAPLAKQVLEGLDFLHSRRVVHRDIKPDNLLLNGDAKAIKIADFNSAKQIGYSFMPGGNGAMLTNRGTACYSAPEIHAERMWNERVDVWSCGLSICFMILGKLPFKVDNPSVRHALKSGKAPPMDLHRIPYLMRSVVQQCLQPRVHDRPPPVELLAHPAFRDVEETSDGEKTDTSSHGATACVVDLVAGCGLVWRHSRSNATKSDDDLLGEVGRAFTDTVAERATRSCPVGRTGARRGTWHSQNFETAAKALHLSLEEPSPHCDRAQLWSGLAQRRFSRAFGRAAGADAVKGTILLHLDELAQTSAESRWAAA